MLKSNLFIRAGPGYSRRPCRRGAIVLPAKLGTTTTVAATWPCVCVCAMPDG